MQNSCQTCVNLRGICEEYCVKCNGLKSTFLTFKGKECVMKSLSIVRNCLELNNIDFVMHLGYQMYTNDNDPWCKMQLLEKF